MGGPGCSIPLRHAAKEEKLLALRQWLWSLDGDGNPPPGADNLAWDRESIGERKSWGFYVRGSWLDMHTLRTGP
jgi:hypothetical protein